MVRLIRVLSAAVVGLAAGPWAVPAHGQPNASAAAGRAPESQSVRVSIGGISGVVCDERGGLLPGALVSVNGVTLATTISDEHGRFALDRLPHGQYVLRAHLQGFLASPRQIVQIGEPQASTHRLQLRRADLPVGTSGSSETALRARPIVAAGFDLPKAESEAPGAAPDGAAASHPHTDVAWRLRHIKRSILKDTGNSIVLAGNTADIPEASVFGRAMHSGGSLAGTLTELPFTGEVNFLTSALGPGLWSGSELPRGIAYLSLGAPTPAGDWQVRAAMSEADLSSWVVAGSFLSSRDTAHVYDLGLTYSTQKYVGGNPSALAAVKDGSRNVGEIYGFDRWAVSPELTVEYGGRYARYDYLEQRGLISPRLGITLEPVKGTRIQTVLAQRMIAPGAEEFLSSGAAGPWLPPERTFAPLSAGDPLRVERARYIDVLVEHEFEDTYVIGVRRFFQDVDNQLATMFGVSLPDGPRSVGHYYVASAGGINATGWGLRVSSPPGRRVRASLDYTMTRAEWTERGDTETISRWAPAAVRADAESIHDVTTSLETDIPQTATRVYVLYKLNSAFTGQGIHTPEAGMDGRFDLQVNQALPIDIGGTRWEVLFGIRNLFRDPKDPASVYDELLVVRPPKRVVGGFLVRF